MKLSRKKLTWLIMLPVIGGIVAGVWFGVIKPRRLAKQQSLEEKQTKDAMDKDRTYKVVRDDLVIGLQLGGYVNASHKHKLSLQANYRTKLLWVIDENGKVKAGDLLASFETDELKEQIENLEIELDNLKKELDLAVESKKIQISTNAADLQAAEENLLQTDDAMRKYRRFERSSKRDSLDLSITNAESALATAVKSYATTRDSEVTVNEGENAEDKKRQLLKEAQTKIDEKENSLDSAEDDLRVFRRYDNPSKLTRLFNAYEQAKLNLRRVKISTESKIVQADKSIENYRRRIKRTDDQLNRYKSYMEMMELRAPVDGVVIYGDPDRRWGNLDIKPGIEINKGQVLVTIPEMSNLVVDFDLPEQYRSKIKIGDRAVISPDSLPGVKFGGEISHIDTLPVNLVNWDSSSPKIYKSKIKFDHQSPQMVNGMSVQIHIVTKTIPKTLFVPVEAVFEDNDRFFVYRNGLTGPEEEDVTIGESNDNFVQITSGISEGDVVYLYRPYQKNQESK
ncbi:MAG: efflux RND transporter periplasmic adaptor subunit [Victivallales bacterium]|jgi:RND family efflux transporter MFP subunit|nr:efflux RND transporter periplasmic adaptor subunit [Victivallales bacterium]